MGASPRAIKQIPAGRKEIMRFMANLSIGSKSIGLDDSAISGVALPQGKENKRATLEVAYEARQALKTLLLCIRKFDCQVIDNRVFIRLAFRHRKLPHVSLVHIAGFALVPPSGLCLQASRKQIPVGLEGSGKWQEFLGVGNAEIYTGPPICFLAGGGVCR